MKDFPVFTTEHGVASLVLKEIPYQGAAYITLRDSLEPELLLEDCLQFCRLQLLRPLRRFRWRRAGFPEWCR